MSDQLRLQIQEDMKNAMRAKEMARLGTIRLLLSAIKQREIDERITLTDAQILAVIDKMLKQRNDSITQYRQGNRQDLVDIEEAEVAILKKYLPEPLSDAEIDAIVKDSIAKLGVSSIRDMAKVMAAIKETLQGKADMGKVSSLVKSLLQ